MRSRPPLMPSGSLQSVEDCVKGCCIPSGILAAQMAVGPLVDFWSVCRSHRMIWNALRMLPGFRWVERHFHWITGYLLDLTGRERYWPHSASPTWNISPQRWENSKRLKLWQFHEDVCSVIRREGGHITTPSVEAKALFVLQLWPCGSVGEGKSATWSVSGLSESFNKEIVL